MKYFKIILIILIFSFLGLFFIYQNGYYERFNNETKILTEAKIKEYEEDLKNGVDVSKKEYITVKMNYTNSYTRGLLKISHKIEKGINSIIKYIFKELSKQINE